MQRVNFLLVVVLVVCCVSESLAASKERDFILKKKNRELLKSRSESTNLNETVSASSAAEGETEAEKVNEGEKDKEKEDELVVPLITTVENITVESAPEKDKLPIPIVTIDEEKFDEETTSLAKPKPPVAAAGFGTRVRNMIKRVLQYLGLTRQKRKSRMLNGSDADNILEPEVSPYTDEVRATVGAILGRRDCLKRAACGAGSYLRNVKGKEVLIVLLEKLSPSSWTESVNMVKEAAIYKDPCHYECE